MSPYLSRLIGQERHRDLDGMADTSRLAREAARARSTTPSAPTHRDRLPAANTSSEMWPRPRGDALELPGRTLRHGSARPHPAPVDAGASEDEAMVVSGGLEPSTSRM